MKKNQIEYNSLYAGEPLWFKDELYIGSVGTAAGGSVSPGTPVKVNQTVNNGTLTIQQNGTSIGTFSANQSSNSTINIVEAQELPNVDSNDNGKILVVQNGSWTKGNISMQRYYAGASVPSESLGIDGDLYLQIM